MPAFSGSPVAEKLLKGKPMLNVMVLKGFPKKSNFGVVIFGDQNV
jgi:hypothetical protein